MKRILTILLTGMLILSMCMPAFAAEEEKNIDVTVKYVTRTEREYAAPVTDGNAVMDVGGVSVTVTDAPDEAVRLVVFPFPASHAGAWEWIMDCLKGVGTPVHTYDIYFEDQDGNRMNADGAGVSISCPHCDSRLLVCSLDTNGTVQVLESSALARSSMITFATNGSAYYVLVEKDAAAPGDDGDVIPAPDKENGGKDEDATSGEQQPVVSPETGDDSSVLFWFLLMVSGMALIIFGYGRRITY